MKGDHIKHPRGSLGGNMTTLMTCVYTTDQKKKKRLVYILRSEKSKRNNVYGSYGQAFGHVISWGQI
jgi:hypothetical protein